VVSRARGTCCTASRAIKGKTEAAREIREALEGKTPQAFGDDTASMSVTLNIEVVRKKLFGDD
jgi:hypothetical protein